MSLPILSAEQIRRAEQAHPEALADGTLMLRAATAVATECIALLKQSGGVVGRHVLLLVGAGHNGGDALFAGSVLARRGVAVFALPLFDRVHEAGSIAFRAAGGRFVEIDAALALFERLDLVLDGIVGIGSVRPLDGAAAVTARAIDDAQLFTVAIDIPSGVHADTGAAQGCAIQADVTVTFGALRRAHVIAPAALHCGDVLLADIGVDMRSQDHAVTGYGHWFAPPAPDSDKYRRGVAGVVTGSATYPGAALLSAGAAARSGCGMVRYFGRAREAVVAAYPEIVVDDVKGIVDGRCQAWVVGCGLGTDKAARALVAAVVAHHEPVVLDADAITLVARDLPLREMLRGRRTVGDITLLTPHAGELERLAAALQLPCDIEGDRLAAAKAVAADLGVLVLLKGPTTLVTDGERFLATPPLGAELATAGSGDVLAGLIAGAAARWCAAGPFVATDFMQLAAASALRHAAAARAVGTTASDLIEGLPSTTMAS